MAQLELKGFFQSVGAIQIVGDKQTNVQVAIFKVPGYVDDFGDKKGNDEFWEIELVGKEKIEKFDLAKKAVAEPKAKIKIYLNSRVWFKKDDVTKSQPYYTISAALADCEHFAEKPAA